MKTKSSFTTWLAFATTLLLSQAPNGATSFSITKMRTGSPSRLLLTRNSSDPAEKKKIVVVGGGIGGLSCAFDARHLLNDLCEVTVISANDQFQFTPSNPWVGIRKRTPDEISLPLKNVLPRHKIDFIHDQVVKLDPKRQRLTLKNHKDAVVDYDYLIIATGPRLAFEEIPGLKQYGESVCTTPHASHAADALDKLVAEPGPVVIGAVQGASCFGPAYEYALLVQNELQRRGGKKLVEQCPITMVTPEPYVGHLGLQGVGDSQKILERMLRDKNIDYITNCKVNHVHPDRIDIEYYIDGDLSNNKWEKKTLPSSYTMLIPPFRGAHVWESVKGLTDKKGMIVVNSHQQSNAYHNIFGVGVCVSIPPLEETLVATGAPKTGYMIESQGTAAVQNVKYLIKHDGIEAIELPAIPLLNGLCITDFGDSGAIFLSLPQMPPRRVDVTVDGKIATLAKIAFEKYFLHKIEAGDTDPYYEKYMLHLIGVDRTKTILGI